MKKTIVQGPLGIKMPESLALSLESLLKSLPKEYRSLKRKASIATTELVTGERADISMVSVESIDVDGEVVLAKGMNIEFFLKNPVVNWGHNWDEMPIGICQWIKKVAGGMRAKTVYATRPENWEGAWLPDAIFSLTQQGIIKGKSIGFLPTKIRGPLPEETSFKDASAVIESAVLLEYSACTLPCNREALVEAVSKGYKDHAKALGVALPTKPTNETALLLKALEKLKFDPEKIAQQVIDNLTNRGCV